MPEKKYVQKTIESVLGAETVNIEVQIYVDQLLSKGYRKIKVVVHDPLPPDFTNRYCVLYSTTVQATMSEFVEF